MEPRYHATLPLQPKGEEKPMQNFYRYYGKLGIAMMLMASRNITPDQAWKEIDLVQKKIKLIQKGKYQAKMSTVLYDDLGLSLDYVVFFLDN